MGRKCSNCGADQPAVVEECTQCGADLNPDGRRTRITIRAPTLQVERLEELVDRGEIVNVSEGIRHGINLVLEEHDLEPVGGLAAHSGGGGKQPATRMDDDRLVINQGEDGE